jgi:YD repeat-containing protein
MKRIGYLAAAALLLAAPAFGQDAPKMDKKNLVVKEWNMDARSKQQVLDHVTTYNAEGKKVEEIEYSQSGQKWRKRYEYGPDGKVSRELLYNERNRLTGYKKFEYNEFGKKKTQYTYDAKGKLLTIKTFEYTVEDA